MSENTEDEPSFDEAVSAIEASCAQLDEPPGVTLTSCVLVVQTAISFGAPLYNLGEHASCYSLYLEATMSIVSAWDRSKTRGGSATSEAVEDLRRALDRARRASNSADSAWALRHAFDKVVLMQQLATQGLGGFLRLGQSAFARGDYGAAIDAFRSAARISPELWVAGDPDEGVQASHMAFVELGHAQLLSGQFEAARESLMHGLRLAPHLRGAGLDLTDLGDTFEEMERKVDQMAAVDTSPSLERAVFFLRAYLDLFSGESRRAAERLALRVRTAPDDDGTQLLLAVAAAEEHGG
jgi:tetratricopeptide (TPR) repeat protein